MCKPAGRPNKEPPTYFERGKHMDAVKRKKVGEWDLSRSYRELAKVLEARLYGSMCYCHTLISECCDKHRVKGSNGTCCEWWQ